MYAGTKDPVLKEANAEILASMLYRQSQVTDDKALETKLVNEARQVLADFSAAAGDKVDDTTLWMLASYQLLADDFAGSEKSWAAAVNKAPTSPNVTMWRAWWAYTLLRQNKNADALAVVKDQALSDKQPELAYFTAWARWRNADDAGAWQAILTAAHGWSSIGKTDAVFDDLLRFAARSNITVDDALPALEKIWPATPPAKIDLYTHLGLQEYRRAGRWTDSLAVDDKTAVLPGVPANVLVSARFTEADAAVRLDAPDVVAKYAKQAIDAVGSCGSACKPEDGQNVVQGVFGIGARLHLIYSTSGDFRYYQAAHDLYAAAGPQITDPKLKAQWTDYSANLEKTLKNTKVGTGTHDKEAISWLLKQRDAEVQTCYEASLQGNPKLGGTLTVNLESDASGTIKGVATEPKGGIADMAAVAGCVAEHAKQWKLPKRGMAGSTRIKLTYSLSLKAPAAK